MKNEDYLFTPSFFNNEEIFKKYLGRTSYYLGLQECVGKLIALSNPKTVHELGAATGATTLMLAKKFPKISFVGSDIRKDIVDIASNAAKNSLLQNISFEVRDMTEYAKEAVESDFVLLLYSFHHIPDPLSDKVDFLNAMYSNMKPDSYLCIAETFIPEEAGGLFDEKTIMDLWKKRSAEGYASTFGQSLEGLSEEQIKQAEAVAEYSKNNEYLAGELVAKRRDEYLVKRSWLVSEAKRIGYSVVLDADVNCIGDGVVLLKTFQLKK